MADKEDFTIIIVSIREKLNLSQEEMASRLGVSFSTLNGWENGRRTPRAKHARAIMAMAEETEGTKSDPHP